MDLYNEEMYRSKSVVQTDKLHRSPSVHEDAVIMSGNLTQSLTLAYHLST